MPLQQKPKPRTINTLHATHDDADASRHRDPVASRSREHVRLAHRAPRCCHIKANGLHCGSPALRGNVLCYFHDRWLNSPAGDDVLPPLEDGNGVQFSLMYVVSHLRKEALRDGTANIPAVKQLLYALQTASHNLRYVNFDPKLKSSTTDPYAD
ncbi:MAG: hypothetical protein HYX28_09515 [Candidatus Koribacter versatilis]|uniref:Uncharacterized protein n=1 Tax=Candidatus Korobacter versatilis TaxID=658062 RepID=A0A932AAB9_9BACT|nr:hypothetical protein [Candidatus Koribacter versatilis]